MRNSKTLPPAMTGASGNTSSFSVEPRTISSTVMPGLADSTPSELPMNGLWMLRRSSGPKAPSAIAAGMAISVPAPINAQSPQMIAFSPLSIARMTGTSWLPIRRWVHVAVTLRGTSGRLYVDGKQVASADDILLTPRQVGDQVAFLGRDWGHLPFNGRIQDFRVHAGALTPAEVEALAK